MRKGVVTVVLPIYNVEQYLDRCIESVVNQTYHDLEIILVDDGSPDRCPEICEKWKREDPRIKVIHKKNAGVGMARNTGIEHATGEYICFFDSDDYIALDAIEKAYQCIYSYSAEIVLFGCYYIGLNGKIVKGIPQTDKILYQGDEVQTYILPNMVGPDPQTGKNVHLQIAPWGGMYSMAAIRRTHWRFVSERQYFSDDMYSLLLLYKDIKYVAVLPEALYFYCKNRDSLTQVYRKERYERIKFWYDGCIKTCDELEYGENIKTRLPNRFIGYTIATLKIIAHTNCSKREKKAEIYTILKDRRLHDVISDMNIKYQKNTKKIWIIAVKFRLYELARWLVMAKSAHEVLKEKDNEA